MRRETYSSLKAVWGARRVAARFVYREPIEVMGVVCPECGQAVDVSGVGGEWEVECRACHGRVRVPGYVVAGVDRRRLEGEPPMVVARRVGEAGRAGEGWVLLAGLLTILGIVTLLALLMASLMARG